MSDEREPDPETGAFDADEWFRTQFGGEKPAPAGCELRGLDRRLHRLRSGVCELKAVERGRQHAGQALIEFGTEHGGKPSAGVEDTRVEDLAKGGQMRRMGVPKIGRRRTADEVEIGAAFRVEKPWPLAPNEDRGIWD